MNLVFRAHLASQVLWVPKVSQVKDGAQICHVQDQDRLQRSRHGDAGSQNLLPRACTRTVGPKSVPLKKSLGVRTGVVFLAPWKFGTIFPSLSSGPVTWPLTGWVGQEVHSQTSSTPDCAQTHLFRSNMCGQLRANGAF